MSNRYSVLYWFAPLLFSLILMPAINPLAKAENNPSMAVEPMVVPPISFVDVNSGRFGKLEIDLENGQFLDTAVDKLHLVARDFDVQPGTLKSLNINLTGGHIHDF